MYIQLTLNVLVQKNVHATRFVEYVCVQVLPVLAQLGSADSGADVQLELLKLLAEMVGHCGELLALEQCTANVYDCLMVRLLFAYSFSELQMVLLYFWNHLN